MGIKMEVKQAWWSCRYPTKIIIEGLDGKLYWINHTPARIIESKDLEDAPTGLPHPSKTNDRDITAETARAFYGLKYVDCSSSMSGGSDNRRAV